MQTWLIFTIHIWQHMSHNHYVVATVSRMKKKWVLLPKILIWSCLSIMSMGRGIRWRLLPPLAVWLCPFLWSHPGISLLKSRRSGCRPCSYYLSIVLVCPPSWRLFDTWFLSLCGLPEGRRVSSKCLVVCHMPSLSLLICRGNAVPPLRLGSSGGYIGCISCSVLGVSLCFKLCFFHFKRVYVSQELV